ncbi:hypothetical protein Slin14017_G025050 [Septoria linicola]|nr:hypothetical protein Slin14017_G025050 [Septoria linicola]
MSVEAAKALCLVAKNGKRHRLADRRSKAKIRLVKTPATAQVQARVESRSKCHLLNLPAELRNAIWELALTESEDDPSKMLLVTPSLREPGLLLTNKQIRNETHKMWFSVNFFNIHTRDCNSTLQRQFFAWVPRQVEANVTLSLGGGCNWANLMEWCKHVFEGKFPELGCFPADPNAADAYNDLVAVAASATSTAADLRANGAPWRVCEMVLGNLRWVAGRTAEEWLED